MLSTSVNSFSFSRSLPLFRSLSLSPPFADLMWSCDELPIKAQVVGSHGRGLRLQPPSDPSYCAAIAQAGRKEEREEKKKEKYTRAHIPKQAGRCPRAHANELLPVCAPASTQRCFQSEAGVASWWLCLLKSQPHITSIMAARFVPEMPQNWWYEIEVGHEMQLHFSSFFYFKIAVHI